jgi:menaquinone-specific isochorismate synthase
MNSSGPTESPGETAEESWAWLAAGDGRHYRHAGKFRRAAEAPADALAWYVNDFTLSDPMPWRIPEGPSREVVEERRPALAPGVAWQGAERVVFDAAFARIMAGIEAGRLVKAVPVSTAVGACAGGIGPWVRRCLGMDGGGAGGYAFGWNEGVRGFGGFSPEILFQIEGRRLTSMALAGTVDAAHAGDLELTPKLGREHAVVVDALRQRLEPFGRVMVGRREVVAQGSIRHLRTRLNVQLDEVPGPAALHELVRRVHPTPALGISPCREDTLEELHAVREAAQAPASFGAPFGVSYPGGALFIVAIRALFWDGNDVRLPAGCGLVSGSEATTEWEEIELKRAWVRRVFGLG